MPDLHGFPVFEIRFDRDARSVEPAETDALLGRLEGADAATDLLVLAHGWNNDLADARQLYKKLLQSLRAEIDGQRVDLGDRQFAVAALFWPSKKFTDEELISGGAAAAEASAEVRLDLERLREPEGFGHSAEAAHETVLLSEAKSLVDQLEDDEEAQRRFVEIIRELLPRDDGEAREEIPPEIFETDPGELLIDLGDEWPEPDDDDSGGAAVVGFGGAVDDADEGGAVGIADLVGGVRAGARKLLNYTTYYRMKARAGTVGEGGVFRLLERLRREHPSVRLHLIGHSFGGRLVAAATRGPDGASDPLRSDGGRIDSLTLLQAAFSHFGFAEDWSPGKDGYFRSVLDRSRVRGPIVVTHTRNDSAVGIAYALASRVMRQVAAAVGDADDKYGGIGSNGALKSGAVDGALLDGTPYAFEPGRIHNLEGGDFITDHGAVHGRQVAHAILSAIEATPAR